MHLKLRFLILMRLLIMVKSVGKLNKIDQNSYYITGRGCGILKPIKYLKTIPENIDDYHCSIIHKDFDGNPDKDSAMIQSKSGVHKSFYQFCY